MYRTLLSLFLGSLALYAPSAAQAKPPGPSILSEFTLTEGEKASFFTEAIIPLGEIGENENTHYGVYGQVYGNIGDTPAGNAGVYVNFSKAPIAGCSTTIFVGGNQDSQFISKARLFCQL